jgi:hypothetical protein
MPLKTVSDIMKDVFDGSGFKCLLHEKRNLDENTYSEYSESDQRIKGKLFEYPTNNTIRRVPTTGVNEKTPSILIYFMDGSRRVFRFSDIILGDGRYYPVLAGQRKAPWDHPARIAVRPADPRLQGFFLTHILLGQLTYCNISYTFRTQLLGKAKLSIWTGPFLDSTRSWPCRLEAGILAKLKND